MEISLATRPNAPLAYPLGVPLETWAERGRELVEAHELSRWQLAVWWEYGDRHYAEAIQVAEDLGISPRLLHRGAYIIRACEKLPSTVDCRAIPFWNWEPLAHKALEDDERAMLAGKVISEKMPQPKIKALVSEYLKAKSLPEPEQPKFTNGLADGAEDDGLPLAPHGVQRSIEDDGRDWEDDEISNPSAHQQDGEAGTFYDGNRTGFIRLELTAECLDQIDLLRRYYKQPDMTVAQVIERAIGQLSTILKQRLARLK